MSRWCGPNTVFPDGEGPSVPLQRAVEIALAVRNQPEIVAGVGDLRTIDSQRSFLDGEGPAEVLQRFVVLAQHAQQRPDVVRRDGGVSVVGSQQFL